MKKYLYFMFSIIILTFLSQQTAYAVVNANSANMYRVQNSQVTQFHSTVSSTTTGVTNERYDNLPACPSSVSCLDINGRGSATATSCPDMCTITRSVNLAGSNIQSTSQPVCPTGYAEVATYNMQSEISYQPTPIYPYILYSLYTATYQPQGFTCTGVPWASGSSSSCVFYAAAAFSCHVPGVNTDVGGYLGQYTSCSLSPYCYSNNTCTGNVSFCGTSGYIWQSVTVSYMFDMCSPPATLYYTGYDVPTSKVCARVNPVWAP